jgi:hypothetical protein
MLARLTAVFRSFHEHDVRYLVIGGIASVFHGVPRATFDLDILIEATPANAQRVLDALLAAGLRTAELTDAATLLSKEITIFKDKVRIDVKTRTPGLDFAEAWSRRVTARHEGVDFHVISRSDLVASKRASGRPIDMEDVRMLEGGAA